MRDINNAFQEIIFEKDEVMSTALLFFGVVIIGVIIGLVLAGIAIIVYDKVKYGV